MLLRRLKTTSDLIEKNLCFDDAMKKLRQDRGGEENFGNVAF